MEEHTQTQPVSTQLPPTPTTPAKQTSKPLIVTAALIFIVMAGGLVYLGYQNYQLQQKLNQLVEQQQPQTQQTSASIPTATPSITQLVAWKPVLGGFIINLPSSWSASSFDAGPFSEIRVYASGISWEESHRNVEQAGDLTIKIDLTEEKISTNTTLSWTTEANQVKSNKLILQSDKGPITFEISYPSDSVYDQEIKMVIENLNLSPSRSVLENAKVIP